MRMTVLVGVMVWHPSMHDMVHVAHVLYLCSYLVRDILWLRMLTVVAGVSLLPYYFTCGSEPLWPAIAWNLLFALVNIVQIAILAGERWPRRFEPAEQQLYETVFSDLTVGEFRRLLGKSRWRDVDTGTCVVEHGSVFQGLTILAAGGMEVRRGGRVIASLGPGQCIGEMSLLTGDRAAADVVAAQPCRTVSWTRADLDNLLARNADLAFKVWTVLGRDVVAKLRAHHTGAGDDTP